MQSTKKRAVSGCTGAKKPACNASEDCVWVPSKGCRVLENVPLAVLAKIATKAKKVTEDAPKKRVASGCTGAKKTACATNKDCVWVPTKGCRIEDKVPLATLAQLEKTKTKAPKADKAPRGKKAAAKELVKPTTAEAKANRAARAAVLKAKKAQKGGEADRDMSQELEAFYSYMRNNTA